MSEIFRAINIEAKMNGRKVLSDVTVSLQKGETLGIFGTFNSGKTALLDLINGKLIPNKGAIYFEDKLVDREKSEIYQKRVFTIKRDSSLIGGLKLWENIFVIRRHGRRKILLNKNNIHKELKRQFQEFGIRIDPDALAISLSPVENMIIEIFRAYLQNAKIVLISEFASDWSIDEYELLNVFLEKMKDRGLSFVISSHRIELLKKYSQRIAFLVDGSIIKSVELGEEIAEKRLDQIMEAFYKEEMSIPAKQHQIGDIIFTVKDIQIGLQNFHDLELRKGEIVAFRDPYKKAIGDLVTKLRYTDETMEYILNGKSITKIGWQEKVIFMDFGARDSVFSSLSVIRNICLANYKKYSYFGFVRPQISKFILEEFETWLGKDYFKRYRKVGRITQGLRIAILLYRLKLVNPDVLICLDPFLEADILSSSLIRNVLTEMAHENNKAVFIMISSKDKAYDFADKVILVSKDSNVRTILAQ